MQPLRIIKIGGKIIDDEVQLHAFLKDVAALQGHSIVVHGGGKLATRVAEAMGIEQHMVQGRRITDAATLKVATMVYAGAINKNIVALLQSLGCNAIGLSGADANLIKAHKRIHPVTDFGFVGDVDAVNDELLASLLQLSLTPVFSPITHNAEGVLLNTNADTIAQELAKAMSKHFEVSLIYCFEKPGVLLDTNDDTSVIKTITVTSFFALKEQEVITEGMIPKLQNAFAALDAGVKVVTIGNAKDLPQLLEQKAGSSIVHDA